MSGRAMRVRRPGARTCCCEAVRSERWCWILEDRIRDPQHPARSIAALRLRFRPGRIEPVGDPLFGHLLPPVRPLWVRVEKRGMTEVPVLCPVPVPRREVRPSRDRKGPE